MIDDIPEVQNNVGVATISLSVWDEVVVLDLYKTLITIALVTAELIFGDFESRRNLIGLYDLLLRVDRRVNPSNYD